MNAANLEQTNPLLRGSETWELLEKLSNDELADRLKRITGIFGDQCYVHKGGNMYYGGAACTINKDGRSWIGMTYHPVSENNEVLSNIVHTRPMDEFLNKFTKLETIYKTFSEVKEVLERVTHYTIFCFSTPKEKMVYTLLDLSDELEEFDDLKSVGKVKVIDGVIVESTISESTVGKSFNQIYKTSVELDQFLTEK